MQYTMCCTLLFFLLIIFPDPSHPLSAVTVQLVSACGIKWYLIFTLSKMKKSFIVAGIVVAIFSFQAFRTDNEVAEKAELGKLLFFDPLLSKDNTVSCASCHKPGFAFADTFAVSAGVGGRRGVRNTPSAMNLLLQQTFFWDGRAETLEKQALAPIENPDEMNLPLDSLVLRLKQSKAYTAYFKRIFNSEPTREHIADAIAAFERTLETSNSPFDEWKFSDDPNAVSESVKRGFIIFNEKGKCIKCHFGADFTQPDFRNIGLFNGKNLNDSGRAAVTGRKEDIGKFKIGSLRNVAITAPYMHNGMFNTLEEVIEFYNDTRKIVPDALNTDNLLAGPLNLTQQEKSDLKAFLVSLTDKAFSNRRN
jgi:cytochrome c peroxidase